MDSKNSKSDTVIVSVDLAPGVREAYESLAEQKGTTAEDIMADVIHQYIIGNWVEKK